MQTIEYRTVDKSGWPRGEWDNEPDKVQWRDEKTGLPCLIKRHPYDGFWCGYVGVSAAHPNYGMRYDDISRFAVDVELSFSEKCSHGPESTAICHIVEPGEDEDVWWLGFHCGDDDDVWPGSPAHRGISYYNQARVTALVKELAMELAGGGRS
jgi:hypothetical protein